MVVLSGVILFLFFVVEIATVILTYTGMDIKKARFQALSAITSTGFSTKESEIIMRHPVRRKVVMILMGCSFLGIASIVTTLFRLFNKHIGWMDLAAFLIVGYTIYTLIRHPKIAQWIGKKVYRGMNMRVEGLEYFEDVLRLGDEYIIREIPIQHIPDLIGCSLREVRLKDQGILVLAIRGKEAIYNMPHADYRFTHYDRITIYGPIPVVSKYVKPSKMQHA